MAARIVVAVVALAGASVACAADDAALAAVESCRARLDARTDVGLDRIEKRCPGLVKTLEAAPWAGLLPNGMRERRDDVSAESLRELVQLVRRAKAAPVERAAPDTAALAPVLEELGAKAQEGVSRWERLKRWLKEKLERRDEPDLDDEESWLKKLGRQLETSEGVAKFITYTGYALVALLVAFVIWSELRAAGLLGGTRRGSAGASAAAQWKRRLTLADIAGAPLAERPGLLLRLLGEALTRAHRLPAPDGLTASGIARRAKLEADEREELQAVANTADTVRYGRSPPADAELEGAVNKAQELLGKVAKLPGARR